MHLSVLHSRLSAASGWALRHWSEIAALLQPFIQGCCTGFGFAAIIITRLGLSPLTQPTGHLKLSFFDLDKVFPFSASS